MSKKVKSIAEVVGFTWEDMVDSWNILSGVKVDASDCKTVVRLNNRAFDASWRIMTRQTQKPISLDEALRQLNEILQSLMQVPTQSEET